MSRFFIALILTLTWAWTAQCATTITVKPESSVRATQMVTLGEIADVTGAKEIVERLKLVEVARAALPGSSRQVTPDWIKTRLSCAGFDPKSVTIKSPPTAILRSASQAVKGADVIETAKQSITSRISQTDLTYTVTAAGDQPDTLAPTGKLELVAEPSDRAVSTGRQIVNVDILVDGTLYMKKSISLSVQASGLVLVATQAIKAKEPLTASNCRLDQRDISNTSAAFLTTAPDDGAKIASRPITAGMAITPDMLTTKPAVSKGDPVIVMVRSGGVKVVVKGTASQDGVVGDSVRVTVPTTREDIQAVIVQPGLVEVKI